MHFMFTEPLASMVQCLHVYVYASQGYVVCSAAAGSTCHVPGESGALLTANIYVCQEWQLG